MPPKKKAQKQDEDDPTLNILKFYKKKCDLNGIPPQLQCKFFKDKVDAVANEGEQLEKVLHDFILFNINNIYSFILKASFMG